MAFRVVTLVSDARGPQRRILGYGVLGAALLLSVTLGVALGPVSIPAAQVWRVAASKLGLTSPNVTSVAFENIVWLIRFPRTLLAAIVGAGLAVVGVTMQALVRNALADPYILGISSGASVGAVLALGLGTFAFAGVYALPLAGFLGALLAFLVVFALAHYRGQLVPARLILAGVGTAYVFSGITSFLTLTSDNRFLAGQVLSWTLGSLARADWDDLGVPAAALAVGLLALGAQTRGLNALSAGDETATTLGINVARFRLQLFVLASLLTGVMVAVSGAIGFVGLIVPHIVRLVLGADHRRLLPVAGLVGGIFLVWVDVAARTAFAPLELPVGVITSLLGGPFFLWLLWHQGRR